MAFLVVVIFFVFIWFLLEHSHPNKNTIDIEIVPMIDILERDKR